MNQNARPGKQERAATKHPEAGSNANSPAKRQRYLQQEQEQSQSELASYEDSGDVHNPQNDPNHFKPKQ